MRKILTIILALALALAPLAIPAASILTVGSLTLEAQEGTLPRVNIEALPAGGSPLVKVEAGGKPVDALRLAGPGYEGIPPFYSLVMGEVMEARFADPALPARELKPAASLKLLVLGGADGLLVTLLAQSGLEARFEGSFGEISGLAHLAQGQAAAGASAPIGTPPQGAGTAAPVITKAPPITKPPVMTKPPVITYPPAITKEPVLTKPPATTTTIPADTTPPATTTIPAKTTPPVTTTTVPADTTPPVTTTTIPADTTPPLDPCLNGHLWGPWEADAGKQSHTHTCQYHPDIQETLACQFTRNDSASTPATCGSDGVTAFFCGVCGNGYTQTIPKLPHPVSPTLAYQGGGVHATVCANDPSHILQYEPCTTYMFTTPASCFRDGFKTYTCKLCNGSTEVTIPAGHIWGGWVYNMEMNTHTRTCMRDAAHTDSGTCTYDFVKEDPATCTSFAYKYYACTVCGGAYKQPSGEYAPHTFTVLTGTQTVTTQGTNSRIDTIYNVFQCADCTATSWVVKSQVISGVISDNYTLNPVTTPPPSTKPEVILTSVPVTSTILPASSPVPSNTPVPIIKEATCYNTGLIIYGATPENGFAGTSTEVLPMVPHDYVLHSYLYYNQCAVRYELSYCRFCRATNITASQGSGPWHNYLPYSQIQQPITAPDPDNPGKLVYMTTCMNRDESKNDYCLAWTTRPVP